MLLITRFVILIYKSSLFIKRKHTMFFRQIKLKRNNILCLTYKKISNLFMTNDKPNATTKKESKNTKYNKFFGKTNTNKQIILHIKILGQQNEWHNNKMLGQQKNTNSCCNKLNQMLTAQQHNNECLFNNLQITKLLITKLN